MIKKKSERQSVFLFILLFFFSFMPSASAATGLEKLGQTINTVLGKIFFDFTTAGQTTFDVWARVLIFFILFSLLYLVLQIVPPFKGDETTPGFSPRTKRMGLIVAFALAFLSTVMIPKSWLVVIATTYGLLATVIFVFAPLIGIIFGLNKGFPTSAMIGEAGAEVTNTGRARNAFIHGLAYYFYASILHNFTEAVTRSNSGILNTISGNSLNLTDFASWNEFIEGFLLLAAIVYFIIAAFAALDSGNAGPGGQVFAGQPGQPGQRGPPGAQGPPGANAPGGNLPGGNQPGGNRPGGNQPGAQQPGGNQPGGNAPPIIPPIMGPVEQFIAIPGQNSLQVTWNPPASGNVVQYELEREPGTFWNNLFGRVARNFFTAAQARNFSYNDVTDNQDWKLRIRALGATSREVGPWTPANWLRVRIGPQVNVQNVIPQFEQEIIVYRQRIAQFQQMCIQFSQLPQAQRGNDLTAQNRVNDSVIELLSSMNTLNGIYANLRTQMIQLSPQDRVQFIQLQGAARLESMRITGFLTPQLISEVGAHCPNIQNIQPLQFP